MTDIYEQHTASFRQVSAYVVVDEKGDRIATIAFKFPKDGAGRLYCYLHIMGLQMVRGNANGYGYDKSSAAAWDAIKKVSQKQVKEVKLEHTHKRMFDAIKKGDSGTWNRELETAGYKVYQAV